MFGKIFHIVLAFLLYLGSAGVLINRHYCREQLKASAFFLPAEKCHHGAVCPMHASSPESGEKGCCSDRSERVQLDVQQEVVSSVDLPSLRPAPLAQAPSIFLQAKLEADVRHPHFLHYKPPLIVYDLPVALQTFRC